MAKVKIKPNLEELLSSTQGAKEALNIPKAKEVANEKKKTGVFGQGRPTVAEKVDVRVALYFTKTKEAKIAQVIELTTGIRTTDKGYQKARQNYIHSLINIDLRKNGIVIE